MLMPNIRPANPNFSSGPCSKRPGWTPACLEDAAVGRSHRSELGKGKLASIIDRSKTILGVPEDYHVAIVPASDTGAVEMVLWSMLGARGLDILAWESFGMGWATDVEKQLKLDDVRVLSAAYGFLPDLGAVNFSRDVVFTWNGTTSGVRVPNGDWIADDREGLTICDATSAVFAMDLPWKKLDVVTWSWQKILGGEAAHGMLALSPRAVERLETYTPSWPLPKIFRLTKGGKLNEGVFRGETINTPSMLAAEDCIDTLRWAESVGGLQGLIARSQSNLDVIREWVDRTDWVEFLAQDTATLSSTSICLSLSDNCPLSDADKATAPKKMAGLLEAEGVAYDIAAHRDAPAGLRIWGGSTIEASDMVALTPWLEWSYGELFKSAAAD